MNKSVNTLKLLSMDAINKANSGHPGMVLGASPMMYSLFTEHIRITPEKSDWFNRDRFVLAAGHASSMLYTTLHLSGYDVSIEDLKNFRQWGSKTPGHPEFRHTDGIDATSGPLGQGIAMGAGMALAETFLAEKYNKDDLNIIDHYTYVLCGDGDLQEGVTQEAMSLAGHLGLNKLIVLYDSNDIQLDGAIGLAQSEDTSKKYEAMNWNYLRVEKGSNVEAISSAIAVAKKSDRPTIIEIKTLIGAGSHLEGDSGCHGAPLGAKATDELRNKLGHEQREFEVADEVYADFKEKVANRGDSCRLKWEERLSLYKASYPNEYAELLKIMNDELIADVKTILPQFEVGYSEATRNVSGVIINKFSEKLTNLMGGSADLTKSTKAKGLDGHYSKTNRLGRNINFGVREHAMGAMINGMTLHSGVKAFTGAFFVFSDYMKPAMRMASLMNIPSIFVFTHDSIAVGEDGPTHEPIEQLVGIQAIPNMNVIRPADANETLAAWQIALESKGTPTTIVLTRQNLTVENSTNYENVSKGGYIVSKEHSKLDGILIAAGSEVNLAIKAQAQLLKDGKDVRVVSMPSTFLFEKQTEEYKEAVLPKSVTNRLAIEMGSPLGWYKYSSDVLGIETFGASAPGDEVIEKYGFTVENVIRRFNK